MPGYDSNLDECLFVKSWESGMDKLNVSVYSYNKGAKKLQITRQNKGKQDDFRFVKLGRLNKEEMTNILPLIQEALAVMD